MRHPRGIALALASACCMLMACASKSPYQAASKRITGLGYNWARLDDKYVPGPVFDYDGEILGENSADLRDCINALDSALEKDRTWAREHHASVEHVEKEGRTIELVSCMAQKKWAPIILQVVVTS